MPSSRGGDGLTWLGRAAGILLFGAVQVVWCLQPLPVSVRALHVGLVILAVIRPDWALLTLALLAPAASWIRHLAGANIDSGWLFDQMAVAVVIGTLIRWPRIDGRARLTGPAIVFAALGLASWAATFPSMAAALDPGVPLREHLAGLWHGVYFARYPLWEPFFFATLAVTGAVLGITAERLCRAYDGLARRVVYALVIGTAAAALVNLNILHGEALRTNQSFWRFAATTRFNYDYDVNAAGPVFAMTLLAGVGLVTRSRRHLIWAAPLVLIASALWVTGSRAALVAAAVAFAATLLATAVRQPGRPRRTAFGALAIVAAAAIVTVLAYPSARNQSLLRRFEVTTIMARTSWNMIRSAPVFGVGIGRFWEQSSEFGASALYHYPGISRDHENAHNNFLQVFAEEGVVGFAALLAVLGAVAIGLVQRSETADPHVRKWVTAGLGAFVVTWLVSHPMLVRQSALSFWLIAGVLASQTPPVAAAVSWTRRLLPAALTLVVLATAPIRADRTMRFAVLEYRGVGVSKWQHEGPYRYREAGATFALYLPGDGRPYLIPVRRAPGAPGQLRLQLSEDGRLLNEVIIEGDDWVPVSFQYPAGKRRYPRIDFLVEAPGTREKLPDVVVHVRKEEER